MPPSHRSYSIVEPHPTAPSNTYIHTGRGGAGNFTRAPPSVTRGSDASGPASRLPPTSLSSHHPSTSSSLSSSASTRTQPFVTGRGGAGNIHHVAPSERAIFSFDEELEQQLGRERHAAPVYHVGRGGAGNVHSRSSHPSSRHGDLNMFMGEADVRSRRHPSSDDGASGRSTSSAESGADVATRKMVQGWKKVMGKY